MGLLPARIMQPKFAAGRVRVLPGSTAELGRALRGGSRRDPAGARQDGRTGSRAPGCEQHHRPPHRRRTDDADQRELVFPDAAAGSGRVAPDAAVRAAADAVGRGEMRPFVLHSLDQHLPDPPPSLQSPEWVEAFNETQAYGALNSSVRTDEQTAIARFWSAHVVRQYNRVARDIADARSLGLPETARLAAMINLIGADALMSTFQAKYHYSFWRPVTVIDPTAVTNDGFGPVPGYDDANPATVEEPGWRPLMTTPNHPEYPSAHGTITSAVAEVLTTFLGTNQIDLDIHGFDPAGPPGNLNAVRHFDKANALRHEIIDARVWAGFHYRFSDVAGIVLGRQVANFDLRHAFQPID
jgi:hypothetical protein